MSIRCVAKATRQLSRLINGVLKGASAIILRDGQEAVELRPILVAPRLATRAALDLIDTSRVGKASAYPDAGTEIRRDERP